MIKTKTLTAFDALNPAQRRAATHGAGEVSGPLLILAGAGTGKPTRSRIAQRTWC